MAFQVSGGGEEVMSEINVTPLVDVMLVLLVVFLVTAPLLTNTIRVNLPETSKTAAVPVEQKKSVNISIDATNKVYVDRKEVGLPQLEPQLKALHAAYKDVIVHLNADRASPDRTCGSLEAWPKLPGRHDGRLSLSPITRKHDTFE